MHEDELPGLLAARNSAGPGLLYDKYASTLYGVILRIVQDNKAAEEVFRDAFAKICTSINLYQASGISFRAWVLNMARSEALKTARGSGKHQQAAVPVESY